MTKSAYNGTSRTERRSYRWDRVYVVILSDFILYRTRRLEYRAYVERPRLCVREPMKQRHLRPRSRLRIWSSTVSLGSEVPGASTASMSVCISRGIIILTGIF
jgi:hypothetical protein